MDKAFIEAAIKKAESFTASHERDNVLGNLKALHRHARVKGGETLTADEKKLPAAATYTRTVDVEADLADLARREAVSNGGTQ